MSTTMDGQNADEPSAAEQDDASKADAEHASAEHTGTEAAGTEPAARRVQPTRRRRPEQTKDDTDLGWGDRPDEDAHERWLREQRPPHWE